METRSKALDLVREGNEHQVEPAEQIAPMREQLHDGTNFRPDAVAVIDKAIELLGHGERWIQFETRTEQGRCMMSALRRARFELKIKGDKAGQYIGNAIAVLQPCYATWASPTSIRSTSPDW
jgi:hypothetical protein